MFEPEDWAAIFEAGEHAARSAGRSTSAAEVLARVMQAMKDQANELAEYYYEEEPQDGYIDRQQSPARSALPGPGH